MRTFLEAMSKIASERRDALSAVVQHVREILSHVGLTSIPKHRGRPDWTAPPIPLDTIGVAVPRGNARLRA
jgi:hypothetical protein